MNGVDTPTGSQPTDRPGPRALAAIGPFFGFATSADGHGWRPLGDLVAGPALDERVDHVATALGRMAGTEVEPRVAASTLSLGLFARLLSPAPRGHDPRDTAASSHPGERLVATRRRWPVAARPPRAPVVS